MKTNAKILKTEMLKLARANSRRLSVFQHFSLSAFQRFSVSAFQRFNLSAFLCRLTHPTQNPAHPPVRPASPARSLRVAGLAFLSRFRHEFHEFSLITLSGFPLSAFRFPLAIHRRALACLCLFSFLTFQPFNFSAPAATVVCTNLIDALGTQAGVTRVTFTPQATVPQIYGNQTVLPKVVAAPCDTNSAFAATILAGGFYTITFLPANSYVPAVTGLVPPNDAGTYTLNQILSLATNKNYFPWTNPFVNTFTNTTNSAGVVSAGGVGTNLTTYALKSDATNIANAQIGAANLISGATATNSFYPSNNPAGFVTAATSNLVSFLPVITTNYAVVGTQTTNILIGGGATSPTNINSTFYWSSTFRWTNSDAVPQTGAYTNLFRQIVALDSFYDWSVMTNLPDLGASDLVWFTESTASPVNPSWQQNLGSGGFWRTAYGYTYVTNITYTTNFNYTPATIPVTNYAVCTLYVETNGSDVTGIRGDPTHPFQTIGYSQWDVDSLRDGFPLYFSPTGALASAQAGDLIKVGVGWFTNYFIALWDGQKNGVSLKGSGRRLTKIYQPLTPDGYFFGSYLGGSMIQLGNNSEASDFYVLAAHDDANAKWHSFGPCLHGSVFTATRTEVDYYTSNQLVSAGVPAAQYSHYVYGGFTNGVMRNVEWEGWSDGIYLDGITNQSGEIWDSTILGHFDAYASFRLSGAGVPVQFKSYNCNYISTRDTNYQSAWATAIHAAAIQYGTNYFKNCTFTVRDAASPAVGTNIAYDVIFNGYNGTSVTGVTNINARLDNCTYDVWNTSSNNVRHAWVLTNALPAGTNLWLHIKEAGSSVTTNGY